MSIVCFKTPGLIDLRLISLMGFSHKPESDNPIGYFGTGLKYSIATILRSGGQIEIWRGYTHHVISVSHTSIRGRITNLVLLDEQPLNFTTELGKNWKLDAAYRELHSNTLDEGGVISAAIPPLNDNSTIIAVNCPEFYQWYLRRREIFPEFSLHRPLVETDDMQIFDKVSGQSAFYNKGVLAYETTNSTIFDYNFFDQPLTEDRTISNVWSCHRAIAQAAFLSENESFLETLLTAPLGTFEHDLEFDWYGIPSETFLQVVAKNKSKVNSSALAKWAKTTKGLDYDTFQLDAFEQVMFNRACAFIKKLNYDPTEYEISFAVDLSGALARARNNKIVLTKRLFNQGTKQLTATLLEEIIHCRHNVRDYSVDMQNLLFDIIVSLGERHITKEPL